MGDLAAVRVGRAGGGVGTGGMTTKIEAAAIATGAGIPTLLGSAADIESVLDGGNGTLFHPFGERTSARLLWLRHATTPRGRLVLDQGAVAAVVQRRASLLPAGIKSVSGEFDAGDPVELITAQGEVVARGLVGYDSADLPELLGRKTVDLPVEFRREVVHRDDLVLL